MPAAAARASSRNWGPTPRAACEEVVANAKDMLGNTLVTKQTGDAGKQVNRLYIEDGADIDRELYLSLLVDRTVGQIAFVASTEGGMDIETVAEETPEKILTLPIDPVAGVTAANAEELCNALKLGKSRRDAALPDPLQGLRREGYEPSGDQSADRHDRWSFAGA